MTQASEPYRPSWITVRRVPGWWTPPSTGVALDGRRAGYLGAATPKTLRVAPGEAHVVAVRLGWRWVSSGPITLGTGERVRLVCGVYRWFPGAGAAVLRWLVYRLGQVACAYGVVCGLVPLREPLFDLWVAAPLSGLDGVAYRAIQVLTSAPGAALVGLAAWPLLAWPLTRAVRADRARWYYFRPESAPDDEPTDQSSADEPALSLS